ncbi:chemotaxis protein methyltransferase CheR [Desulfocucumis palustris]|uniref:Chemotaxis protein methyltransferase CheR n=1 Tax=Desulfocucumis palustris TaxID=1898651 RepID=A0A2L2XH57_9FIRM|nr:protein-glutamate O-methyltransferase CheR [Desulfocucumis palustris]GBF33211.1 chemotaxis protein methyltransferase CheR [Desulfocucumis palustris]
MDFTEFQRRMLSQFRLDLLSYKENQLKRRLEGMMARQKIASYGDLFSLLREDRMAYETFLDQLTINVSEFFRDPLRWAELQKTVLPGLLQARNTLKIWSAACSNGPEPYSLAILLDEISPGKNHRLEASDIDKNILNAAAVGKYNQDMVRNVNPERLNKYFTKENNYYLVKDSVKRKVTFKRHDLLTEPYGQGYDLIVCRNVTIYFTREAQDRINSKFSQALTSGGILFIGGSEMIFNYQELGLEKLLPCFYRKVA